MNTDKPSVDPDVEAGIKDPEEIVPKPSERRYHFPDTEATVHEYEAKVYHFRWPDYSSWVIFTVCDATGEFGIQSDWGGFFFRWNTGALGGKTLTEFLASSNDPWYVMRKFRYDRPDLEDEFDEDATRELWQKMLWERMDGRTFDVSDAEKIGELMERFFDQCQDGSTHGTDIAMWTMESELHEFFHEEPWEYIVKRPPWKVVICQNELLPRFFQHLRDHVVQSKVA